MTHIDPQVGGQQSQTFVHGFILGFPFSPAAAADKGTKAAFVMSNPQQALQPDLSTCADAEELTFFENK